MIRNIVYEFTEYYKKVYQPNTVNADSIFQDEVNSRLVECPECPECPITLL